MSDVHIYGYVRVSTKEQNEDRQFIAMHEFGIGDESIYHDKQSGKNFDRPAYKKLLNKLKPGDVVVIKSIDRLGRDYEETLEQWRVITKERQAAIVVLDMPLLDTRQKERDLTGTFIADLVLQILSYVAQTERELTRRRQAEGIAAAKGKGVHLGRPPVERPDLFPEDARHGEPIKYRHETPQRRWVCTIVHSCCGRLNHRKRFICRKRYTFLASHRKPC